MSEEKEKNLLDTFEKQVKEWSTKLDIKEKEFSEMYSSLLKEEEETHSSWEKHKQMQNAMRRVYIKYKKQLSAPGHSFRMILVGSTDPIDTIARRRTEAFKSYEEKGEEAAFSEANKDGLFCVYYETDERFLEESGQKLFKDYERRGKTYLIPKKDDEGEKEKCIIVPIDNRETFKSGKKNRFFGRPLDVVSYMRTMFGIGGHIGAPAKSGLRWMTISINGDAAKKDPPPMFIPLKAFLNWSPVDGASLDDVPDEYYCRNNRSTSFEVDKTIEGEGPDITTVIKRFAESKFIDIAALDDYHSKNENDFNRVCIIEGDVHTLRLDQEGMSRSFILDDMTLGFGSDEMTAQGVKTWLPDHVKIDFGEESRVFTIGKSGRGKKRDPITGDFGDEPGDPILNAFGVYPIPEYKTSLEVETISEEEFFEDKAEEKEDKDSGLPHSW